MVEGDGDDDNVADDDAEGAHEEEGTMMWIMMRMRILGSRRRRGM